MVSRILGGFTAIAGTGFALGKAPRSCAVTLASVAVPIALIQNPVWTAESKEERERYRRGLERYGAVLGGLLLATVDRKGQPSKAWALNNWRQHQVELAEARNDAWIAAKEAFDA